MSYLLKVRVDKAGIPAGAVLAEDVASLSQGLYDSVVRLIQHELGYTVYTRPKNEARRLSRVALSSVTKGSGVLQYDLLPVKGLSIPKPPSVVAATSLVQGVAEYTQRGQWPKYLPPAVRRRLGAAVAPVLKDTAGLSIGLYHNDKLSAECRIDDFVKNSLQEPEEFSVQSPVQLTGQIYDINKNSLAFKVDARPRKIPVHIKEDQFADVDDLRWKRVTVRGYPRDRRCSAVEGMIEIRHAMEEEDDGLIQPEEVEEVEATEAFSASVKSVEKLKALGNDWDSYKAIAPHETTLIFMLSFLRGLCRVFLSHDIEPPVPFIVPTRKGGVQLEWQVGSRELEIEIPEKGRFNYLWTSDDVESEGPISRWDAIRQVWRLVLSEDG